MITSEFRSISADVVNSHMLRSSKIMTLEKLRKSPCLIVLVLCVLFHPSLQARSLFELTVEVDGGEPVSKGFSNAQNFIDQLRSDGLRSLSPNYTEVSQVDAELDARGLRAFASYTKNTTLLTFQVECAGVEEKFEGQTRDESQDLLVDFLEGNSQEVTDIAQCFVSDTPVDPIAGNPNSLMANMAASDFRVGTVTDAGEENLFGIGIRAGASEASDFRTWSVELPINYVITIPNPSKPPYAIIFDLPIRYLNVEGGDLVDASFGLGVRIPVLGHWAITPLLRAGIAGSTDAGALQSVYSASITSKLDFYFDDLRLSLNNMVGYYETDDDISTGDFNGEYDIENGHGSKTQDLG